MYAKLYDMLKGAMKGRTMYVVPYLMGPPGSPLTKVGIELTDSIYVVLNMRIMSRMGKVALDQLGGGDDFNRGHPLHARSAIPSAASSATSRRTTRSSRVGSGYGGNVLLGKKCLALRIGSYLGRTQGWMAEHMLHPLRRVARGRENLRRGGFSQRLRQDEFRHDDPAGAFRGLEDHHRRRRHRLDETRAGWTPLRHQSRGRLLRRRARHELLLESERDADDLARHDLHECRR